MKRVHGGPNPFSVPPHVDCTSSFSPVAFASLRFIVMADKKRALQDAEITRLMPQKKRRRLSRPSRRKEISAKQAPENKENIDIGNAENANPHEITPQSTELKNSPVRTTANADSGSESAEFPGESKPILSITRTDSNPSSVQVDVNTRAVQNGDVGTVHLADAPPTTYFSLWYSVKEALGFSWVLRPFALGFRATIRRAHR